MRLTHFIDLENADKAGHHIDQNLKYAHPLHLVTHIPLNEL